MVQIDQPISKAMFYNTSEDNKKVPEEVLVANCIVAGFNESEVKNRLEELVEAGVYRKENGSYIRIEDDE